MAGGFVLVVGPSGAGKDTLLRLAREALAGDPRFVFPRRLVTRPPSEHEDNETIGEADFSAGEAEGRFALSWRAHNLGYALPASSAALARDGHVVVCNVSRRVVGEARRRLPGVTVVEVTAPPDVLSARLAARGRREDGDLGARLTRSATVVADLVVMNDGSPEAGAARLVAHLRAR
ncbi:ribose-phosphate pyrophosphokinase [Methylobacterium indicum]|uniref:Ribose 1,5-bisphosphate phosphokinase PhnN n=1 Tax=Methylobacterium indicum TaxID=1775910 RepID=A0A8H8WYV1_9HYPH|nr:phosphonate metabolism protein/1,5-bisphosphokinase (PRPP-forming) PhnN [Methylobacterium indicum]KTS28180.1 ribose-phosphate pyrophosphokinase [Methylobacterium indicum]KTS30642.1 ribose-phosphate pyrophosphokinase [Methylobacterium indicum]KTS53271.1 ribose-phosphate pyrophosphokinase [Methylobacterium indicum]BCM86472.1 ribose 1,5-bisphosphate phosphokinase PhnN [Methylobacterium indicum]